MSLLYLVINICNDRLSQQSFLEVLSNSSREKYINTTERHAQGASAVWNKISQGGLSSTQLVSAKFNERQTHNTQLKTVVQFFRIDNSIKPEPITSYIFGLLDF